MVAFNMPLANDKDHVDVAHDDTPLHYHTIDNILGEQPIPRLVQYDVEAELHLEHDSEPCSFAEVEGDIAWHVAM